MGIRDRLPQLLRMRKESFALIQAKALDLGKDRTGSYSASLSSDLRFFGVAEYVLGKDTASFKRNLEETVKIALRLFERYHQGEPTEGYVNLLAYKDLFSALAAGNFGLARELAAHLGFRGEKEEKIRVHAFDLNLGMTLKAFAVGDLQAMKQWAAKFSDYCQKGRGISPDFRGYAQVYNGILDADAGKVNDGLKKIVEGHIKQSQGNGVFVNNVDEVLCVWGIGMANLARMHGLAVQGVPPLVPDELLV